MTATEGGGTKAIKKKFNDVYLPALKANWVWAYFFASNVNLLTHAKGIVACGPDHQFSIHAAAVSDCEWRL